MTVRMQCLDEAALVDFVYEEDDTQERETRAAHIASCLRCTDEVRALQSTRQELRAWAPPEVALGFQIVATGAAVPDSTAKVLRPAKWWHQPLPAWAQVAAAVVLFSAGAALGVLRGANVASDKAPAVASSTAAAASAAPVSLGDLAALEQRLRAEMSQREPAATPVPAPAAISQNQEALMEEVRALIGESERRQQQELTLRAAELVKDVDAQRRGDLARIERTFGQMEGTTGVQVEQQRQLLNYLMRVSQRQPQ